MKSVYYWSPYLTNVATIQAVLNSAKSIKKYSLTHEPVLINSCGEFDNYKKDFSKLNIKIVDLVFFKYHKFLPSKGFLLSRFSFIIIFLVSFLPLMYLVKSKKPDFFIFHLITSLPTLISNLINTNTKFILRISGLPKYNFFRKFIWKNLGRNIHKVTCPTIGTIEDLKAMKIFDCKKIFLLRDPVINLKKIKKIREENYKKNFNSDHFSLIAIGRLTKQKNFQFLIKNFEKILNIQSNAKLYIIGEGEDKNTLNNLIVEKNLVDKIFLLGFRENIFSYIKDANLFILSSLWEDPGWVIIEAAACNTLILTSNCKNGPQEFIENDQGGILFQSNSLSDFLEKFKFTINLTKEEINKKKIFAKKKSKLFTIFRHFNELNKILKQNTA